MSQIPSTGIATYLPNYFYVSTISESYWKQLQYGMSFVVDNTDVTVDLPDEVLCHVFSFLSLKDKLQSEAVNHKFQRCVIKELRDKPQPLELDLLEDKLNGYDVSPEQIFGAVQTLAKKAKFSGIWVDIGFGGELKRREQIDQLLSLLISENQCLTKVTTLTTDSGCSQTVLDNFLAKCEKLSTMRLEFKVRPINSEPSGDDITFPLDLCQLLANRGLTELELNLSNYPHGGLVAAFQAMKPNTLNKICLCFDEMPTLNMVELVNALNCNAGSTLVEIHLALLRKVHVQLPDLFESLARLPVLRKCDIDSFFPVSTSHQFVPAATSLFMLSHHMDITVKETQLYPFFTYLPGCQIVDMIRQIQNVHPWLVVDFDRGGSLILTLGNASIRKEFVFEGLVHCAVWDCVQCQSFYPALLRFLGLLARNARYKSVQAHHFPNWQLDRCRVGQILDHLNLNSSAHWRALSVEAGQDQQSVTINFEIKQTLVNDHQLSVTISCGSCLTNGCMKC